MKGKLVISLVAACLLIGCGKQREFNRVLKHGSKDEKFTYAVKYYEDEDYFRAIPLLENLIAVEKGGERGEKIYYYYAHCQYGLKDYYLAGYYFKQFAKTYAGSELAEECAFMSAYCSYILSPGYELDQGETKLAMSSFQIFMDRFPNTVYKDTCNTLMDILANKLEVKAFENAKLYYQIENYKSAAIAFSNVLKEFPETRYKEEILFLIVESNYLLAINSVASKKEVRLTETIKSYHTFVAAFPDSSWRKRADNIKSDSEKALESMSSTMNQ